MMTAYNLNSTIKGLREERLNVGGEGKMNGGWEWYGISSFWVPILGQNWVKNYF